MNTANKRQYFTLCPHMEETKYIYLEYEDYRKRMVTDGHKPASMSRYLTDIIIGHFSTSRGLEANG